jgi:opine dehydrogenase
MNNIKYAIIGGGNAGAAFACQVKFSGRKVSLFDIVESQLKPIIDNDNVIEIEGNTHLKGSYKLDTVTTNINEAVLDATVLICTTPAHTHKHVAKSLAPILKDGQMILLSPGRTGGVLEFKKVLTDNGCTADVVIVESQTIPYACRKTEHTVHVFGIKKEIPCAGIPANKLDEFFSEVREVYPVFVPAKKGLWETSLNNIGMLFHPTPTLFNMGRMESGVPFDYYIEGFTPSICEIVEKLDQERLEVAKALGIEDMPSVTEWLELNYNAKGDNLYEALQNNESYKGIKAPAFKNIEDKLGLRYVIEDVPSGLVPFSCLANKLGVKTPTIDMVVNLASNIYKKDFIENGRNLEQLGLENMSIEEIKSL